MFRSIFYFALLILATLSGGNLYAQTTGILTGKAVDKQTGDPMIGAVIRLENTSFGGVTDFEGNYRIENIPVGKYDVLASYVGYATQKVTGFPIKKGVNELLFSIGLADSQKVVVIRARKIDNTEMAIIQLRQQALTVMDGMSAQELSRTGSSNVGDAMKQVTGASVEDGKYMVVRGLGDRYSITQLNGVTLPSTDPYRNSTNLDLIPASMLENIITTKTFSPDQPGNFTGGSLNIKTKAFPNAFTLSFNVKSTYNFQSSFNNNFLTYDGGKTDWLGYDDGTRAMPSILQDKDVRDRLSSQSFYIAARQNEADARLFDQTSRSLSRQFTPTKGSSLLDNSLNFSIGNQHKIFGKRVGYMVGGNYSRNFTYYENGISAGYELTGNSATALNPYFQFSDTRGIDNPQVGGMGSLSVELDNRNRVSANILYNHDGEKSARYMSGTYPGALSVQSYIFETRALSWKERQVLSYQLNGTHAIGKDNIQIEWTAGRTNSRQDEPDLRFFANSYDPSTGTNYLNKAEYDYPFHFFRYLEDQQDEAKLDITFPIGHLERSPEAKKDEALKSKGKIKIGAAFSNKVRDFDEYRYQVEDAGAKGLSYTETGGNPDVFFGQDNIGIIDTTSNPNRPYVTGLWILNQSRDENFYTGTERIFGAYAMAIYPLTDQLKFVGGLRMESTDIQVQSAKEGAPKGVIKTLDPLPSINLIYALGKEGNMNLRAAASQTLARPNMRELAPFASFDFIGGFIYRGNDQLKRSLIRNYDLRWEWFPRSGEVIAASVFYKRFQDPIIKVFSTQAASPEIKFDNVDNANAYGIELEFRKGLDQLAPALKNFKIGSNLTLIYSRVKVNDDEFAAASANNPEFKNWRPFQGQSPYIVNAILTYQNDSARLESTLSFNVTGTRLSEVGQLGTPDIYEIARPMLNYNIKYGLTRNLKLSVYFNNLLNPAFEKRQVYNGQSFITQSYKIGRSVGLSLGYTIR